MRRDGKNRDSTPIDNPYTYIILISIYILLYNYCPKSLFHVQGLFQRTNNWKGRGGIKYEELNMKNTLNVPFQVILCPACCNFHAHLNIFIAATSAGEYAGEPYI